jgi:hypothetical protein
LKRDQLELWLIWIVICGCCLAFWGAVVYAGVTLAGRW